MRILIFELKVCSGCLRSIKRVAAGESIETRPKMSETDDSRRWGCTERSGIGAGSSWNIEFLFFTSKIKIFKIFVSGLPWVAEVTHVIHSLCIDLVSRQSAQRMAPCPRTVKICKVGTQLVIPLFRAVESMQNERYTGVQKKIPNSSLILLFWVPVAWICTVHFADFFLKKYSFSLRFRSGGTFINVLSSRNGQKPLIFHENRWSPIASISATT